MLVLDAAQLADLRARYGGGAETGDGAGPRQAATAARRGRTDGTADARIDRGSAGQPVVMASIASVTSQSGDLRARHDDARS